MGEKGREGGPGARSGKLGLCPCGEAPGRLDGEGGPDSGGVATVPLLCTCAFPQSPREKFQKLNLGPCCIFPPLFFLDFAHLNNFKFNFLWHIIVISCV